MTEKQLKEYVLRLFKFKSISSKQFMIAKSNLEKTKENDPLFFILIRENYKLRWDH